jgi:hypothetical protein
MGALAGQTIYRNKNVGIRRFDSYPTLNVRSGLRATIDKRSHGQNIIPNCSAVRLNIATTPKKEATVLPCGGFCPIQLATGGVT